MRTSDYTTKIVQASHNELYKYEDIDGEPCEAYPDFNAWVKALEADPSFIEKEQKRLDKELGKDRIF